MRAQIGPKSDQNRPRGSLFGALFSVRFLTTFFGGQKLTRGRFLAVVNLRNPSNRVCFAVWTRSGVFLEKNGPRSLPVRFLRQKGSQKAPQNGPKWSQEASFSSAVFPPIFSTVFDLILGALWPPGGPQIPPWTPPACPQIPPGIPPGTPTDPRVPPRCPPGSPESPKMEPNGHFGSRSAHFGHFWEQPSNGICGNRQGALEVSTLSSSQTGGSLDQWG